MVYPKFFMTNHLYVENSIPSSFSPWSRLVLQCIDRVYRQMLEVLRMTLFSTVFYSAWCDEVVNIHYRQHAAKAVYGRRARSSNVVLGDLGRDYILQVDRSRQTELKKISWR